MIYKNSRNWALREENLRQGGSISAQFLIYALDGS
jgi:hypothetical protein